MAPPAWSSVTHLKLYSIPHLHNTENGNYQITYRTFGDITYRQNRQLDLINIEKRKDIEQSTSSLLAFQFTN